MACRVGELKRTRGAVCGYLKACAPALAEILPTSDNVSKKTASCETDEERERFIPRGGCC